MPADSPSEIVTLQEAANRGYRYWGIVSVNGLDFSGYIVSPFYPAYNVDAINMAVLYAGARAAQFACVWFGNLSLTVTVEDEEPLVDADTFFRLFRGGLLNINFPVGKRAVYEARLRQCEIVWLAKEMKKNGK